MGTTPIGWERRRIFGIPGTEIVVFCQYLNAWSSVQTYSNHRSVLNHLQLLLGIATLSRLPVDRLMNLMSAKDFTVSI